MLGGEVMLIIWAFMASWLTPIVLFGILNLMIAAIFVSSNFKRHHHTQENSPGQLARAPSLLQRLKSINFSFYTPQHQHPFLSSDTQNRTLNYTQEEQEPATTQSSADNSPSQLVRIPSLLDRLKSFKFPPYKLDPFPHQNPQEYQAGSDHHVTRSKSDTNGVTPVKVVKKSASEKGVVAIVDDGDEVERRPPATMRERKARRVETARSGEEEGVDAKADDFINRFKQQLKLQRLDSLLRYKEMLSRGSAK